MRVTRTRVLGILLALAGCSTRIPVADPSLAHLQVPGQARRVILFIGDGMGDSEITIARNYAVGAGGRLEMDRLPATGACTTYAVEENDPRLPVYVADSAAGGTALATGAKTSNRRVSTEPRTGRPLTTIVELARSAGLRTGLVTTADVTDATPACFASHASHRSCRSPSDMQVCPDDTRARGGRGSIAEQLAESGVDIILGGGLDRFAQPLDPAVGGRTVVEAAQAGGYKVVRSAGELAATIAEPSSAQSVLGLFAPGDFDHLWSGDLAMPFPGSGPQRCREGRRPEGQPTLPAMTAAAIAWLDRRGPDGKVPPGFFLMVEGSSIDKCDHEANPCGQIGETVELDDAVAVARQYAADRPDTLIIVTADHGHASQAIFPPGDKDHSPGVFSILITREGAQMVVNYGTNLAGIRQSHSGTQVKVAAQGPHAAGVIGVIDHTDVFRLMVRALGLDRATADN